MNELPCPYEDEDCNDANPRDLCDGCREDKARDQAEIRNDTFD